MFVSNYYAIITLSIPSSFNTVCYGLFFSTSLKVLDSGQPEEEFHLGGGRVCIRSSMSST